MTNVIVLTAGLTGSSVLTGLIARAGYWTGQETVRKSDYDTYENARLIELNKLLFASVGFDGEYDVIFPGWVIDAIENKFASIDPAPFEEFIAQCNRNAPWIWKDPRLTLTWHAWARWVDLDNTRFVIISRESTQSWISTTLRRQIQTYSYNASYYDRVQRKIRSYADRYQLRHIRIVYEDLLVHPEKTLDTLNQFLDTQLTVADLTQVYRGKLYQRHHGAGSAAKAILIYLKNFRHRHRLDHT